MLVSEETIQVFVIGLTYNMIVNDCITFGRKIVVVTLRQILTLQRIMENTL